MSISYKCETDFWNQTAPGNAFLQTVHEPVSAFSGLCIIGMALAWNGGLTRPRMRVSFARASLFACGMGTVAYHWIDEQTANTAHINRNSLDGVTMALFTVSVFALYLSECMARNSTVVAVGFVLYLLFWIITNDSDTYPFLSSKMMDKNGSSIFAIAVQYPTFVAPYLYIFAKIIHDNWCTTLCEHAPMWIALLMAVVFWILYEFACSKSIIFFFAHALWHVGISYVSVYLIALGVKNTYKLTQKDGSKFWPSFDDSESKVLTNAKFATRIPIMKIPVWRHN